MFRSLLLTTAVGGLAVAAPVPKAQPVPMPATAANLTLGTATLDGQRLRITYSAPAITVASGIAPAKQAVLNRPTTRTTIVSLESVSVTTADGTELTGDELAKRLGGSAAVARSTSAIDPEWKKVFADDVLFIEPNGKAAQGGVLPPRAVPGGGIIVRPAVIRPAIRPLPVLPPVEEPPVEKKEEKK